MFCKPLRSILLVAGLAAGHSIAPIPVRAQAAEGVGGEPGSGNTAAGSTAAPAAPDVSYLFLRPELEFGSAARFSPLSVLVDRGFSTLMWDSAERHPLRLDWATGWRNVWDALAHPRAAIDRSGGPGTVLREQFLPEGWDVWKWAFAANYSGHVVNGGVTYRTLAEWYDARGVPLPRLTSALTSMATILVNEAIEDRGLSAGTASTTFDVYVFDPLGIALFSVDPVARFFARTLHAQDWSPQSALTLPKGQLLNGAQMISYHFAVPGIERLDVLSVMGQGSQMGVLWDLDGERSLGGAVGFASKERKLDELGRERLEARASGALYFSRHGSLLASLTLFKGMDNRAALNLYPGWSRHRLGGLGAWALLRRSGDFSLGISSGRAPGLGFGYDFWRAP